MNDSHQYITISFSIVIYAAFVWFLGNRFLRSFIRHSLEPAILMSIVLPMFALLGLAIDAVFLYFFGITDISIEFSIAFVTLSAVLWLSVQVAELKLSKLPKSLQIVFLCILDLVRDYYAEFFNRVKRSSNSVTLVLQEKTAKEAGKVFFSNINNEIKEFPFISMMFLCFVVFFLCITSELWPISNFVYWNWYLKYSNFQKFVGNCIFGFLLFFLFYVAHRQRLKAIFSDFILVLKVAKNNGRYLFVKGRGEVVDGDLAEGQLIEIESLSAKSPIFFTIDDDLCLLLDSRVEFKDFLTLMRSVREFGVDVLADKLGISVENYDED